MIIRAADTNGPRIAITVATALIASFTSLNPLIVFAAAAVLGILGLV